MQNAADYNWLLLLSTQGLPVLTSANSKEPEAIKLRIVANHFAMEYLRSPLKDKLDFLDSSTKPLQELMGQLQVLLDQLEGEKELVKKDLAAACQTA